MPFLKSLLTGIIAALVALIAWIAFRLVQSVVQSMQIGAGAVSIGIFLDQIEVLAAALIGFVVGFYWQFRRLHRVAGGPSQH
jgi:hypothetical protein